MITLPEKISLANLPTRTYKLQKLSEKLEKNIYIKRDDETGVELSGNKVRKLEFVTAEAKSQGATVLITCGGIQSNHARATAVAAIKLGMKSVLVLRESEKGHAEGNHLLDLVVGADIRFISAKEYAEKRFEIMEDIKKELESQCETGYIIPEGASNGIGLFGYINAMKEIKTQEEELGMKFDAIVSCVGSAGTYAGLVVGSKLYNMKCDVIGFNIADTAPNFQKRSFEYIKECCNYLEGISPEILEITEENLIITDGYAGKGYALNVSADFEFIKEFARLEGIFLDPVYTGKTLKGMVSEIAKSNFGLEPNNPMADFSQYQNILFIHTGGLYGLFPKAGEMSF
ncbi:D-cysteine desulfhydrase family protein [Proteocatella sphenisci]|uniref:D-cysteine desulfhydrase family protein n=1 Tax=Proteocatella sphenisci TaxID=181070 RepID=UPI00048BB0FE|nr:D-cysteine desulfhydrase family protein [Proteocatella sphenisci]